ncbi:MAG: hypothetical protein H0Z33_02420 [Bacillaceae bacterium]|nr:hypothetical protein [Bacillaceae bacterium]
MFLNEILSYTDIGQLHRLAETFECRCNLNSKNELIQSILTSIKKESVMKQQLERLSQYEQLFLMYLLFDHKNTFTLEDLRAAGRLAAGENNDKRDHHRFISLALRSGWLFQTTHGQFQTVFQKADDLTDKWKQIVIRHLKEQLTLLTTPDAYRDEGDTLARDVYIFLDYVHKHQIPLTSDGVIYKRKQQQILSELSVPEPLLEDKGWRFGYGRRFLNYPDRFSLLYDFCYAQRLIEEDQLGSVLRLTDTGMIFSQDKKIDVTLNQLQRFWIKTYKKPVPGTGKLARIIGACCADVWVEEQSIIRQFSRWVKPFYYDSPENIVKERLLKMMVHLGLLQKSENEPAGYKLSKIGQKWITE